MGRKHLEMSKNRRNRNKNVKQDIDIVKKNKESQTNMADDKT